MLTNEIINLENRHESGAYTKRGVAIVRGEGEFVYDSEGKRYIDCIAGHGSVIVGHSNPAVAEAVSQQARTLISCPESLYNDRRAELMKKITEIAPNGLSNVFLTNSGTESVEAAIKLARISTGKKEIIAAIGAFHGRTLGALSLTWKKEFREPFEPLLPNVKHVRYNDANEIRKAITDETAAVILEPVLGESGVRIPNTNYLKEVREACDEKNVLFILDEVQTGFGRTGVMFACMREGVQPDIMCVAKGIANGLPMGAVLAREELKFKPKTHGSTFGGNPLACAASLAVINELQKNNLVERSASEGRHFLERLHELESKKSVAEVRGMGLMIAVELKEPTKPCLQALQNSGVLSLPAGETVLRFLPPLTTARSSIDAVCTELERVLA